MLSMASVTTGDEVVLQRVWVVVLTWNGWRVAESCLDSLEPAMRRGVHVLVVDNGSSDGTPRQVRAEFPDVVLVENQDNLGFAAGNNVGIERALEGGAEYVVLLNQDAIVAPDCIDELVAAARRHPSAGTVSAKIYYLHAPQRLWFAGASFSTRSGSSRHLGQGEVDRGQHDVEREIDRGCACAMLISKRALEAVGLFDERLFLYGEEIDFALRERRAGFVDVYAPRARAWHLVSHSSNDARPGQASYYQARNIPLILDRHAPVRPHALALARAGLIGVRFLIDSVRGRFSPLTAVRTVWEAIRDYRHGRTGRRGESATIDTPRHRGERVN